MTTTVLVVDPNAGRYGTVLSERFPGARFVAVEDLAGLTGDDDLVAVEVLIANNGPVRAGIIDRLPKLRWAHSLGAGVDAFTEPLAGRPDVLLTSTRGIHATQMAEMALTQMLVLARDVPRVVGNQAGRVWQRWAPSLLRGKRVGVVGMGVSGRAVGRLCSAFGMIVVGISRSGVAHPPFERVYRYAELTSAAATVDHLVLITSLDRTTRGLVDAAVLGAMKPSAFLVNLSRGGVVDEQALRDALVAGTIRGAAIDVFEQEPLPADNPLWGLPNLFLTPHLGGLSEDYADRALEIIIPNLDEFLSGGGPAKMINLVATGPA